MKAGIKLSSLRKVAKALATFCISFKFVGIYAMFYSLYQENYGVAVALVAYLAIGSTIEYFAIARIWSGKLISGNWEFEPE